MVQLFINFTKKRLVFYKFEYNSLKSLELLKAINLLLLPLMPLLKSLPHYNKTTGPTTERITDSTVSITTLKRILRASYFNGD